MARDEGNTRSDAVAGADEPAFRVRCALPAGRLEGVTDTTTRLTIDGAEPFEVPWGPARNGQRRGSIADLMEGIGFELRGVPVHVRKPKDGYRRATNRVDVTVGGAGAPTHRLRHRGVWLFGTVRLERVDGRVVARMNGRRGPRLVDPADPMEQLLAGALWASWLDVQGLAPILQAI